MTADLVGFQSREEMGDLFGKQLRKQTARAKEKVSTSVAKGKGKIVRRSFVDLLGATRFCSTAFFLFIA